jgi:diguanylate cyclase (GGDEF)-like protein/PAS domain S-box-containing protein
MQLFDYLPTPALHLDTDSRILQVNYKAQDLFGWQDPPPEYPHFTSLMDPAELPHFTRFFEGIDRNPPKVLSTTLLLASRNRLPVTIKASPTVNGGRLFLLQPSDLYNYGCSDKCLHSAILEAQYQNNPGGILLVNGRMEMISFNQEFVRIWDIPPEIQQSRDEEASLGSILDKLADPEAFLEKVRHLYENQDEVSTDEVLLRDGRILYRHTYPISESGRYLGRVWYFLDITPLKRAQYQVEKQQIFLNSILEHIRDGIVACDTTGKVNLFNRASRNMYGWASDHPPPVRLAQLQLHNSDGTAAIPPEQGPLARALSGETLQNAEFSSLSAEGEFRSLRVNGQAMYDGEGNKLGAVLSLHDITDLARAKEQLRFMAYHDALTGLPNRRLFHDLLQHCLKQAHRNQQQVAVLFLDLDNFKAVNDRHGHDQGDQMLVIIARTLRESLRESDILCRWGGDEFVVGLPEIDDSEGILAIAEKIGDRILDSVQAQVAECPVSVSIGIALYPDDGIEPDLLIRNADMAMYGAKRRGKNRCELFPPEGKKEL